MTVGIRADRRGVARAAGFFCALIGHDQGGLVIMRRKSPNAPFERRVRQPDYSICKVLDLNGAAGGI
jgi:hypothetical protein